MLPILDQLIGLETEKPFECVGSREEINVALSMTARQMKKEGKKLPLLINHYIQTPLYGQYKDEHNPYNGYYNQENLVPSRFEPLLKKALNKEEA